MVACLMYSYFRMLPDVCMYMSLHVCMPLEVCVSLFVCMSLFACMSLEMCTCHWRCVHVTGDVCMSLEMCVCHWRCVHVTGDVCLSVSSCSTGVTVALQLLRSVVEIVGPHAAEEALDVVGCSTLFLYTILLSAPFPLKYTSHSESVSEDG